MSSFLLVTELNQSKELAFANGPIKFLKTTCSRAMPLTNEKWQQTYKLQIDYTSNSGSSKSRVQKSQMFVRPS